jgi:hypothetical protein
MKSPICESRRIPTRDLLVALGVILLGVAGWAVMAVQFSRGLAAVATAMVP